MIVIDQKYSPGKTTLHTLSCLCTWNILPCTWRFRSFFHRCRQCSRRLHRISNLAKYNIRYYIETRLELQGKCLVLDGKKKMIRARVSPPEVILGKSILKIYTLRHGCFPVHFLHIFRTLFPKNRYGELLLQSLFWKQ